jgi:Short C-terminal domain
VSGVNTAAQCNDPELARLRDAGILTDDEFAHQQARLLA